MGEAGLVCHIERSACGLTGLRTDRLVAFCQGLLLLVFLSYRLFRPCFTGGKGRLFLLVSYGVTVPGAESLRLAKTAVVTDKTTIRGAMCNSSF